MQKGNIGVTTENIFPVIKKFLYSDHEIFLREMVSNAVDATQKLKTLAQQGEFKGELGDLTVHVSLDADKGTITISDRGIGMTEEEIDNARNSSRRSASSSCSPSTASSWQYPWLSVRSRSGAATRRRWSIPLRTTSSTT